jgi:hypothetical protein
LKQSANLQFNNEYHLAWKLEHDLEKLKSAYGIFAFKNDNADYYFKSDCLKRLLHFGVHTRAADGYTIEALYDVNKELKGIYGQPLALPLARDCPISDSVIVKQKVTINDSIHLGLSWIHQYDKNIKFVFGDEFNLT